MHEDINPFRNPCGFMIIWIMSHSTINHKDLFENRMLEIASTFFPIGSTSQNSHIPMLTNRDFADHTLQLVHSRMKKLKLFLDG